MTKSTATCVASILLGVMASAPAAAQTGCEEVPESRRAQCEKVMDCMAIDDADIRRACIATAQRQDEAPAPQAAEAPTPPVVQTETRRTAPEPVREMRQPAPAIEEQTLATQDDTPAPTATEADTPPLRTPPDSFTGEVTRIHQSVLDRQVIALDNNYVFTSDLAKQARLKVGQMVEAERATSRIRSGRSWRLTGPSRRSIDAFRIRCERDDIGSDNRRRCDRMLDR